MKILLLSQWYPPEPMKLLSDMTESLVAMGHEVTVLTGFPNWPTGKIYHGYRQQLVYRETVNGVNIIRIPLFPDHSSNAIKRAANFLSFALSATILGPFIVPRFDVIHMVHPPITVGLPAVLLSLLRRRPLTIEINDMWPENLQATGMVSSKRLLNAIGSFALWVYSHATFIRVVSPGFRRNLLDKVVPGKKIWVISNWVDTDYYYPARPESELLDRFGMRGRFNILYAGTIGLAQGLDVALDAAALLQDSLPDAQLVLAGDGVECERLAKEAASRKLTNIRFLGRLPGEMMCPLYACADVLMLHLRPDPLYSITVPHKVFTYMAAGKPILVGGEGDSAAVVSKSGAGLACEPGNPEALARAVQMFHALSHQEREEMGKNGRKAACGSYSRTQLVGEIAEMLEATTR